MNLVQLLSPACPIKNTLQGLLEPRMPPNYPPVASLMHFFVKVFLAAPASFFSVAWASHVDVAAASAAAASFSHFWRKLFLAAPANFLSVACASQVMAKLGELTVIRATENKAIKFFICDPLEKQNYNLTKIKFLARVKILRADSNAKFVLKRVLLLSPASP